MAPVVDVPQQLVGGHLPPRLPQLVQQRQERLRVLPLLQPQRLVIVPLLLHGAYGRQPVGAHTHQRRAQHCDQRHVLPGIVHHLQQRQHHRDLHGGEKVLALAAVAGDALPLQRGGEHRHPGSGRTHEDHDVLRLHRPHAPVRTAHRVFFLQQPPHPPRHELRLRRRSVEPLLRRVLHAEIVELRLVLRRLGIVRARMQLLLLRIVQLAHLP